MSREPWVMIVAGLLVSAGGAWGMAALRGEAESERAQQFVELSPEAKQELFVKYERFRQLPPNEKGHLRAVHETIAADPQSAALLATLDRYQAWLQTLSAAQRAELNEQAGQARIQRIQQLSTARPQSTLPFYRPLSSADREVVRTWIERQSLSQLPVERRDELAQLSEEERRRMLVRLFVQRFQPFDAARRPNLSLFGEVKSLLDQLSPEVREQFVNAEPGQKLGILSAWMMQATSLGANDEQLRQFFQRDLNAAERQRLLSLPAEEMQRELRRLYFRGSVRDFAAPRFDASGRGALPANGKSAPLPQRGPFKKNDKVN